MKSNSWGSELERLRQQVRELSAKGAQLHSEELQQLTQDLDKLLATLPQTASGAKRDKQQ